ncbi:6-bladed beta-propeller [Parabacteroides pacaensis]|uniref:6-bladed beta-propeller n=1 Tax=Parabacteroides pacaensis TaxID=2086575 RepID=UPI000D0F4B69|nr:6-bladed beta-propeller [Parabacteroides pacaensis]
MKKELIITAMCAFSILFFSCKENAQKTEIDSKDVKTIAVSSIKESFQDTAYFKDPQIVVLETIDESLIANINRIFMDDNILFIYGWKLQEILMFDINGKYLNKIDRKGEGPGEYVQITDFTIDPVKKQIIVLCSIPEKRMYFTYEGTFIKEESNQNFYSRLTMDNNYIYFENVVLENPNDQLHILDTKTGKKYEGLKPLNIKNYYYANGNSLSRGKNILYTRRYDNSIYELKSGEIIKKYQVDFKEHSFPDQFITEKDAVVIAEECLTHEYIFSMSNVVNNDSYMMFYTNPAIIFLYDKKNDVLTGYKQILNSKLGPFIKSSFTFYFPVENTNKIVCYINDPSFIKHITKQIVDNPDKKIKKIKNSHPKLIEEIINLGNKITDDSNPVLFIYEFKD